MVRWSDSLDASVTFVPAQRFLKNKGVTRENCIKKLSQHNILVDDNLMPDIKQRLARDVVVTIEAIFTITGVPNLLMCPCALAMDKWINLNVNAVQICLGLL